MTGTRHTHTHREREREGERTRGARSCGRGEVVCVLARRTACAPGVSPVAQLARSVLHLFSLYPRLRLYVCFLSHPASFFSVFLYSTLSFPQNPRCFAFLKIPGNFAGFLSFASDFAPDQRSDSGKLESSPRCRASPNIGGASHRSSANTKHNSLSLSHRRSERAASGEAGRAQAA